ncbi:protein Shroom3 isoform X2 [Bufo bufo]|uniref:protein Shroom3 isoform X2 n=1 Tax=Bufo bufo TaxID=8384 RepID=UPI001ABE4B94|nr:protein Shroom3 isoform X2 [Bufo bufo]
MDQMPSSGQPPVTTLYLQSTLKGGAPWGFSLKGGLEHGQPLTISKVEEGGKVDMLESYLQVGDEVVMINGVELSSSRREAISLVKGSYKNLQLVVRRIVPENGLLGNISHLGKEDFRYRKISPKEQSVSIPRPHSWHSSKLLENQPNPSMMQISQGTIGSPWHQAYHSSSSASDLSGYEHGYLRRSPDQYSSRGSMESLEHTSTAYHPCHLSPAKSTNSVDQLNHLHNKRDSAYSSFSTNSSIPEYQPITFCKERSYSMESMLSRGNLQDGIKHADIRYIKTVYDSQRGVSEEYEVNSSLVKHRARFSGGCSRNSVGPASRLDHNRFMSESDITEKAPPMPPTRSDSYAVTKHHERPSSWSSMDQQKSFRTHSKGPGSPMVCSTSLQQKSMYGEGQLHTVMEKSPECSPLMKPKQIYSQIPQPGQPMLPAGIYPVPSPEPHFAHAPQPLKNNNARLYPALAKEGALSGGKSVSYLDSESNVKSSQNVTHSSTLSSDQSNRTDKKVEDEHTDLAQYKLHFSVNSEHQTGSSQSNKNKMSASRLNQSSSKNDHHLKTDCRKNAKELSNIEKKRHSGPGFQYEWSNSQNQAQVFFGATSWDWEPCRTNNSTDVNKDNDCGHLYSTGSSINNTPVERRSPLMSSYKSKLDSASFTKHVEGIDSSMIFYNSFQQPDEPSPASQKNSVDYTKRRLHSGSNQSGSNPIYGKTDAKQRTSVLEKISKIEQREHESQKSLASAAQCPRGTSNRASVNSIDEIRSIFNSQDHILGVECQRPSSSQPNDKITGTQLLKRTGSVKLGDAQKTTQESEADKMQETNNEQCVLQTLPDSDKRTVDSQTMPNKEDHWQSTSQDTLGFNRAYRNNIKDVQSKVLEATSYRRKDLEISPPQYKKQERSVQRPKSAIVYSRSPVSPHAPKERHNITPSDNFVKNQESQSQEGTGVSHQVTRIGARRRLTTEQKKRSYSEPEKMNEVGASDNDLSSTSIQKRGQNISFLEQSVADRRRIFERDGKTCSTVNLSRPELKQLQQNALADYIERKTGRRPSSHEPGFLKERSQSTYFSGSLIDNQSISSTSSMNSLQDHNIFRSRDSRDNLLQTGRISSTLPTGLTGLFDLVSLEKKSDYPETRGRTNSFVQQRLRLESRSKNELKGIPTNLPREVTSSKPTEFFKVLRQQTAEDLVENLLQPAPLHVRSRSSPAGEKRSQDFGVKHEVFVKNTSYATTGTGFRSSKGKSEDASEKATHETAFSSYSTHHTSSGGDKQTRTIQMGIQRHTRAQSLTPASGLYNHLQSGRLNTVNSSSNLNPCKIAQVSSSHASNEFATPEGDLCPPKNMDMSPDDDKTKTMDLSSHSSNFINNKNEKLRTKSSPPQRPPLHKIKCMDLEKEENLSLSNNSSSVIEHSPSVGWKNNTMWSTSSSETETPTNYGKISLRISESCLQSSSPVAVHEEDDDEVFVEDQELETFTENQFVPPSPPPFPPPSLKDALLKNSQEKIQHVSADSFEKNKNERHPILIEGAEKIEREDRTLDQSYFKLPINNFAQPEIPQLPSSSLEISHSSSQYPSTQNEVTLSKALEVSDHKISTQESTLSHTITNVMTPEDVKSQELAKEIVNIDKSLGDILDPELKMKTTMDLMGGLFVKSTCALRESNRRWIKERMLPDRGHSAENETTENGVRSSVCYLMSAPEAELLKRITDIHNEGSGGVEPRNLNDKKAELIASLNNKLEILKHAKESLLVDIKLNNSLGEEMEAVIEKLCKPNEFDKYKMFIGDLDKVVNLLLSLSGRLAKVENVLNTLEADTNAEERSTWNEKKKQLCGQHEDARELKENLDRREKLVTDILGNYLTSEQFQDYRHFVKMKSALLIEQRELDDKIKLGQEQLNCLLESLPSDFLVSRKVPSASSGNVKMLPPLITSL